MSTTQANIRKTILVTIAIMVSFLLLFFNKITTPRYLSKVELKINRLELVVPVKKVAEQNGFWRFVVVGQQQQRAIDKLMPQLRKKIKAKTARLNTQLEGDFGQYDDAQHIAVVNPIGELVAYFRPPFDDQKMILTYSSLFTHNQYK